MNREKWTLFEKKKLIRLLSRYDIEDYQHIARQLPNKSADDVKTLIETQLKRVKFKEKMKVKVEPEPETESKVDDIPAIDKWLKITHGLVNRENLDFSTHLARVMGIIANFETFPNPDPAAYKPDYRAIYRYLGALLSGNETQELGPLESAVVLEILHSLLEVLAGADTAVQRNIMKWKYQLIAAPKNDSTEKMKYSKKVIENDYTDFIRHQEEIGELSDGDSEVEITDELLSDTKPKPGKDNNIVVSAKRGRGRPKKPITETFRPYVCNGSGESGSALDQEGVEVTRMEGITWVRKPKKPRFEFDKVEKRGRPIFRSSEKPGDYVQIKPDLAELTDKTQLNELQQQNTRVVKRKEYTYRPPSREPEVVLVMPPVDKPIVQVNVRDRAFTCTKDGKYKSLGKANKGMLIPNQKKDAQEPVLDATDKSRYKDPNRGLSEEVVVKKYNAVMRNNNEKLTVKDIQNAGNYKYKPKTAPKENRGSICVKLPVKSVDGNIAVEFPVANIESTGNIHVQLSANNIENAKANVKIPNVVSSTGGPVNSVTDKAATKDYALSKTGQETQTGVNTDKSVEPPVLTVKDVPNTQRSTKGPPLITAESRVESQAAPQTLERLAEHVKSKSVGLATSSPTNKTVKMLSSTLSRTPGTPASKRVIVIRKPSGSATSAGLIATEIPAPGPSTSVMLSPGPSPSIMPSKRLSTLKILSTGEIVSTASVGTDSSEVSSAGTVASETPSTDRDINAVSSTQSPRPDITVTGPVIRASGSLGSRSTKVVRIDTVPAASVSNPVGSVQSSALLNSAVHVPGPQGLTEMSFPVMSSPGQPVMQSPGPDNQTVPTVPEFSAVPFTQSEQQMDRVPVSGILRKTEKQRKKRAFDKSRYTAFVKEDEMTKYTEKAPKKPKLYSLNPFCVPISLLDIGK